MLHIQSKNDDLLFHFYKSSLSENFNHLHMKEKNLLGKKISNSIFSAGHNEKILRISISETIKCQLLGHARS